MLNKLAELLYFEIYTFEFSNRIIVLVGTGFRALVLSIQILVFLWVNLRKIAINSRLIHVAINLK